MGNPYLFRWRKEQGVSKHKINDSFLMTPTPVKARESKFILASIQILISNMCAQILKYPNNNIFY